MSFFQQYKRLDNLCKDLFLSDKGISTYIESMEKCGYNAWRIVGFDTDLQMLKRYRHIRNLIAHEDDANESDYCDKSDEEWIIHFHERIIRCDDPLALYRKTIYAPAEISKAEKETNKPSTPIPIYKDNPNSSIIPLAVALGFLIAIVVLFLYVYQIM